MITLVDRLFCRRERDLKLSFVSSSLIFTPNSNLNQDHCESYQVSITINVSGINAYIRRKPPHGFPSLRPRLSMVGSLPVYCGRPTVLNTLLSHPPLRTDHKLQTQPYALMPYHRFTVIFEPNFQSRLESEPESKAVSNELEPKSEQVASLKLEDFDEFRGTMGC